MLTDKNLIKQLSDFNDLKKYTKIDLYRFIKNRRSEYTTHISPYKISAFYLPYKDGPKSWGHYFSVKINHKHYLLVFLS